jgi:predicted nucleic acid-binding protein
MPKIELFFDSSALMAGIISELGAARALLQLGESKKIHITVSQQVIAEVERNLAHKVPRALPFGREIIRISISRVMRDPDLDDVKRHLDWIKHAADVPILVAAMNSGSGYLVTLNTHHFMSDPGLAERYGLTIGTPGDALTWALGALKLPSRTA